MIDTSAQKIARLSPEKRQLLERLAQARNASLHGATRIVPCTPGGQTTLSFSQERLWIIDRMEPGNPLYNVFEAWRLRGGVNSAALKQAMDHLLERHGVLRTRFSEVASGPAQGQLPGVFPFEEANLSQLSVAEQHAECEHRLRAAIHQPFDLSDPPLARAVLLHVREDEHVLLVVMHHIVSDGWSRAIFSRELSLAYAALLPGKRPNLPALPIQYADYAVWQRNWLSGAVLEGQLEYWRKQLVGLVTLELPTDHARPAQLNYRGDVERFELPAELTASLKALGRQHNATLYMVLLAAFQVLLMRYSGQEDIAVGTPVAGRNRPELEGLIGFFVNTLVMRGDLSGNPGFGELLARTRRYALDAYTHQDLPFEKLVEELKPERDMSRNPLFQVMFTLQNTPEGELHLAGLSCERLPLHNGTAKFDLSLSLTESQGSLQGILEYSTELFDSARIQRLAGHYRTLLESLSLAPDTPIWQLALLTEPERHQLLVEWNDTATDYPRDRCVHELFEAQAARTPDAIAVVFRNQQLTYRELNARANQLAHYLRRLGVGPDVPVGVYGERSLETVIALLAVLKAGGAYVPLDPDHPTARLEFMLEDPVARVLLAQRGLPLPAFGGPVVVLEEDWPRISKESTADPAVAVGTEHLAYVMYTSGSTGIPKGVAVPHRAVLRLLCGIDYAKLDSQQVFLLLAPLVFDASTFELWGALLHGGRCVVFPERVPSLPGLGRAITEHGVNTLWLTTALFNAVIDERPEILAPVRQLLTGGEALSPSHVRRALACLPGTRLINGYGPTEGTTFTCCYPIPRSLADRESSVPIGRPIANTRVYVLDEYLNPVPVGVPGELYIAGDGLARGYINRPELTAERFVPDLFQAGGRLYRTGDWVRYQDDGTIEFIGRTDHQVKLRGYRIELGEVEALLNAWPGVRQSAVILREDHQGDKRLVAYVAGQGIDVEAQRARLKDRLPDYMIPGAFIVLDSLPLTPNGKLDRKALPAASRQVLAEPDRFVAPRDAIEVQLMRIWEELLGKSPIGMRDNFFELGGHSLLAIQFVDRVKQLFGYELPVDTLWYFRPSIEGIAGILRERQEVCIWSSAVPIKPEGSRSPIFCPPIAGGHIYFYDKLARHLSPEQPVYGLPAQGADGRRPPHTSIEEMAKHAIGLMREIQPQGPYSLLGYCSGGVIAFEMARQLQARGEDVALLALIDSEATSLLSHFRSMFLNFVLGKGWRYSQERLYALVLNAIGLPQLRRLKGVGESHRWALWGYKPQPFGGRIILFRPENYEYSRDPMLGWGSLAQGGVEVHSIPGKHGDLVKEPRVKLLATELNRFLP